MRIVVGADHRGYELKNAIAQYLRDGGHEVLDVGTNSDESVDYPDLAVAACREIQAGNADRGILVCGSGVGVGIAANKLPGIRARLCHDTYSARQGVEHDDMNVIGMGSLVIGPNLAVEIVDAFVNAKFMADVDRYQRRLDKVIALEQKTQPVQ
jgi:ribose 5-phosphate isomerase B